MLSTSLFTSRQKVRIESHEGLFPLLMERNALCLPVQRRILSVVCKEGLSANYNTQELCFRVKHKHSHSVLFCAQDCEDHAVLLCSLLLGFGLDAYVCCGTKAKGAVHCWVMTLSTDGLVTFWESLNGHRYTS